MKKHVNIDTLVALNIPDVFNNVIGYTSKLSQDTSMVQHMFKMENLDKIYTVYAPDNLSIKDVYRNLTCQIIEGGDIRKYNPDLTKVGGLIPCAKQYKPVETFKNGFHELSMTAVKIDGFLYYMVVDDFTYSFLLGETSVDIVDCIVNAIEEPIIENIVDLSTHLQESQGMFIIMSHKLSHKILTITGYYNETKNYYYGEQIMEYILRECSRDQKVCRVIALLRNKKDLEEFVTNLNIIQEEGYLEIQGHTFIQTLTPISSSIVKDIIKKENFKLELDAFIEVIDRRIYNYIKLKGNISEKRKLVQYMNKKEMH